VRASFATPNKKLIGSSDPHMVCFPEPSLHNDRNLIVFQQKRMNDVVSRRSGKRERKDGGARTCGPQLFDAKSTFACWQNDNTRGLNKSPAPPSIGLGCPFRKFHPA